MDFTGKTAIVTGGAQGIGLAISLAFASAGAAVIMADIDEEAGKEAEGDHREKTGLTFIKTDVASEDDIRHLVDYSVSSFGRIDFLVNNAAIGWTENLSSRSTDAWNLVISVNLTGAYLMVKYCCPHMKTQAAILNGRIVNQASIVNISSTRALMSEADSEPYSASKGGILALTHSLAVSLGPEIRVNCISPGWIDVGAWKKRSARTTALLAEADHRQHPAGRVGRPEDIAHACLFLCSEDAGFITGANLVVDGGMTKKMIYQE